MDLEELRSMLLASFLTTDKTLTYRKAIPQSAGGECPRAQCFLDFLSSVCGSVQKVKKKSCLKNLVAPALGKFYNPAYAVARSGAITGRTDSTTERKQ